MMGTVVGVMWRRRRFRRHGQRLVDDGSVALFKVVLPATISGGVR